VDIKLILTASICYCGTIYHFISVTLNIANFRVSPVTENAFVWLKIAALPTFRCSAPYKCTYLLTYCDNFHPVNNN